MGCSPLSRFSDRVEDYARARPSYPLEVLDVLREETGLLSPALVADVGAGTGISSALFLDAGHEVYAIEPNGAMRRAAEAMHGPNPRFHSVAAPAEATTLPDASVDLVVAAQAFHWFDQATVRPEFARILRPGGRVLVMWNTRRTDTTAFLRDYETLLQEYGTDYREVSRRRCDVETFFADGRFVRRVLPNGQVLDEAGLRARLLSSSYTPAAGDPRRGPMLHALAALFTAHQDGGVVQIDYDTELFIGQLDR